MQFNNNFIYNADRGFIFAYVPKVACSNWKCVLRYLEGYDNYLDTKFAHDKETNGLRYLMNEDDPWSLLNDPSIKKITFVRDPFSRCLSAYLNKIEFNLAKLSEDVSIENIFLFVTAKVDQFRREVLGGDYYPMVNFEVFLRWLQQGPKWLTENEHWRNQTELTLINSVQYDFIGRFENFEADTKHAMELMGCDIDFPTQQAISFAPTMASEKTQHYYDDTCEQLVSDIFHMDFKYFNYATSISHI